MGGSNYESGWNMDELWIKINEWWLIERTIENCLVDKDLFIKTDEDED